MQHTTHSLYTSFALYKQTPLHISLITSMSSRSTSTGRATTEQRGPHFPRVRPVDMRSIRGCPNPSPSVFAFVQRTLAWAGWPPSGEPHSLQQQQQAQQRTNQKKKSTKKLTKKQTNSTTTTTTQTAPMTPTAKKKAEKKPQEKRATKPKRLP